MTDKLNKLLTEPVKEPFETQAFPEDSHSDPDEIEQLFYDAFEHGRNQDFVADIYDWWDKKEFLTDRQYSALVKLSRHPDAYDDE